MNREDLAEKIIDVILKHYNRFKCQTELKMLSQRFSLPAKPLGGIRLLCDLAEQTGKVEQFVTLKGRTYFLPAGVWDKAPQWDRDYFEKPNEANKKAREEWAKLANPEHQKELKRQAAEKAKEKAEQTSPAFELDDIDEIMSQIGTSSPEDSEEIFSDSAS